MYVARKRPFQKLEGEYLFAARRRVMESLAVEEGRMAVVAEG